MNWVQGLELTRRFMDILSAQEKKAEVITCMRASHNPTYKYPKNLQERCRDSYSGSHFSVLGSKFRVQGLELRI